MSLGTADELKKLLTFWTGWDVVPEYLEVVVGDDDVILPRSSTCLFKLTLSRRPTTYDVFKEELTAGISSSSFGFGHY